MTSKYNLRVNFAILCNQGYLTNILDQLKNGVILEIKIPPYPFGKNMELQLVALVIA